MISSWLIDTCIFEFNINHYYGVFGIAKDPCVFAAIQRNRPIKNYPKWTIGNKQGIMTMKLRKITSLTAGLSFIMMILTSIVLYIVPHGRVAYWADWRLWGLSKTDWGNLHINLGFLFLIALALHIYYNWKPLTAYLKDRAKKFKLFTAEFNMAIAITAIITAGTYFMIPPVSWVLTLNDYFKDIGTRKYGEPPYGHAELSSLKTFAQKMNLDLEKSLQLLDKSGFPVEHADVSLAEIAQKYDVPPQQIFNAVQSAAKNTQNNVQGSMNRAIPKNPLPGTGNLTLIDFCVRYGLNVKQITRRLKQQGLKVSETQTFKQIAAENGTNPIELYERLKLLK